jgi:hypothetical protein
VLCSAWFNNKVSGDEAIVCYKDIEKNANYWLTQKKGIMSLPSQDTQ